MFRGLAVNAPLNGALLLCKQQYGKIANAVCISCKNQHDAGVGSQAKIQNISQLVCSYHAFRLLARTLNV